MKKLIILSPHRDDAAFSLFFGLSAWGNLPLSLTVMNFFTVSDYAPQAKAAAVAAISQLRRREDRRALSRIDRRIRVVDLALFDAPLRLGLDPSRVCGAEPPASLTETELRPLCKHLKLPGLQGALAPLALGNHVDHWAVYQASLRSIPWHQLGFYEEFPYAARVSSKTLSNRISQTEDAAGCSLQPLIMRTLQSRRNKLRAIRQYSSQITTSEAERIANGTNSSGPGERIWVPRHAPLWHVLRPTC